ncbi:MAG: hypothetical protein EHM72_09525 [Calditrichaeota bacterium]|nr:MAG: hypothetical protein EHM72_09525 [Calditrichota bacterium]
MLLLHRKDLAMQKYALVVFQCLLLFLCCDDKTNLTSPDQKSTGTLFFSTIDPNRIWKIDDNGKNLTEICEGVEFDISPDGQYLVLAGQGDAGIDIFKIDIDGSDKMNLTSELEFSSTYPKWSPIGEKIAFQAGPSGSMNDTWIMNPDGSSKLKLTAGDSFLIHYSPEWSCDGSMLSFIKGIGNKNNGEWTWEDELWMISLTC